MGKFYSDINGAIKPNEELIKHGKPAKAIDLKTPGNLNGNRDTTWLYNARMHAMVPYAARGAIWNQGYANMNAGIMYYDNLHSLARGWRVKWQRDDLPIYFNQFYTPGNADGENHSSFGSTSEMRLGTWMARDIPNVGMASQIDIGGSVHYDRKALARQRLALHALKHHYAKGGLVVGPDSKLLGVAILMPEAESTLRLFYLADHNHV